MVKGIHRHKHKSESQSKSEFEKDFFKLMNNAVFGKIMENIRKHVHVSRCTTKNKLKCLQAKPNFERCTIFDENFIVIHMKNTHIVYDKPYEIQTEDFYKDISEDVEAKFDTCNYAADHPLYSTKYKKVIGMLKDECGGKVMHSF